ncbi:MAG: DUF2164 domain-containing protein [Cephaloticoccus sp.]|nr:DUF2164 domain-containing protein [Cephaloticoccus sp.]
MPIELNTEETADALHSIKKFAAEQLDEDLGDLRAKLLLDYILKEIAPLAYNHGVADAESFLRRQLEELPATCFEPPFGHSTERKRH